VQVKKKFMWQIIVEKIINCNFSFSVKKKLEQ